MRVFVPYCPVDGDDEVTVKCSIDGNDWEEKEPIFQPGLLKDLKVSFFYLSICKIVKMNGFLCLMSCQTSL